MSISPSFSFYISFSHSFAFYSILFFLTISVAKYQLYPTGRCHLGIDLKKGRRSVLRPIGCFVYYQPLYGECKVSMNEPRTSLNPLARIHPTRPQRSFGNMVNLVSLIIHCVSFLEFRALCFISSPDILLFFAIALHNVYL
jgi:hypothetical protein